MSMVEYQVEDRNMGSSERMIKFDSYADLSRFNLSEIFDHKSKEKVHALFFTYVLILLELDMKMTKPESTLLMYQ